MKFIEESLSDFSSLKSIDPLSAFDPLMPSIEELDKISKLFNITPVIFHLSCDIKSYALAIFFVEKRRIHGMNFNTLSLLGYDYFDYNFFYCEDKARKCFLDFIFSSLKKSKIDIVILENVLLKYNHEVLVKKENIFLFDSSSDSQEGFQFIYKKKSLKRHYKTAVRQFDYSFEHKVSGFEIEDIAIFSKIHQERWEFDDIESAFCQPERINLYLSHKNNKILTILRNKDDVIAMHYGMLLGKVLLWHTPSVNIRYLEYSPIELLLYEVAKFCEQNGFSILDYGLGNEKYKERFSNSSRELCSHFMPISYKAHVQYSLMRYCNPKKIKLTRDKYISYFKKKAKALQTLRNKINYYTFYGKIDLTNNTSEKKAINLVVINNFIELVDMFRTNEIPIKHFHYDRIRSGNLLLCLVKCTVILSYGWATQTPEFFVSEINRVICNKQKTMLFDFNTPIVLRKKGYYTSILKEICNHFKETSLAIFSEKNNIASNKAILNVGFKIENINFR
ncbi:MAG: GNAT family N-acetyltransferase [Gammaproteobacteria bacterium]|nr:GNAT family N-acetyltransferase [Gammaproteobacteria bacterium]